VRFNQVIKIDGATGTSGHDDSTIPRMFSDRRERRQLLRQATDLLLETRRMRNTSRIARRTMAALVCVFQTLIHE
jgi:hypothetical protein